MQMKVSVTKGAHPVVLDSDDLIVQLKYPDKIRSPEDVPDDVVCRRRRLQSSHT